MLGIYLYVRVASAIYIYIYINRVKPMIFMFRKKLHVLKKGANAHINAILIKNMGKMFPMKIEHWPLWDGYFPIIFN